MTKKKAAKKAAPKKKAAKVVKMTPKAKTAKPRAASPRSQVLPGMEQVRNRSLDRVCEAISDVRGDLNRLRGEEKDLQGQAVRVMTESKPPVTVYRFAGVELVLVPGDVHLRVRTLKSDANSDAPAEPAPSGQDAAATLDEMTEPVTDAEADGTDQD